MRERKPVRGLVSSHTFHDDNFRRMVMEDLEEAHGMRVYTARDAEQADALEEVEGRPIADDYAMSYDEIAEAIGTSKERVRQIIEGALRKLRNPARLRMLRE